MKQQKQVRGGAAEADLVEEEKQVRRGWETGPVEEKLYGRGWEVPWKRRMSFLVKSWKKCEYCLLYTSDAADE